MKENKTLDRIKLLNEYHFKPSGGQAFQNEMPVKFNEIGKKYSDRDNDYPSFDEYKNEVVLDEEEPNKDEVPQQQPNEPQGSPVQDVPPAPAPSPAPQPEVPQSTPPVAEPTPQVTPQEPTIPQPVQPDAMSDLEIKLNDQISKTEQMLAAINNIQMTLTNKGVSGDLEGKIEKIQQDVQDIISPSPEKQFDMISKQSYPYNIKLSDYWNWKDNDEAKEKEEIYTITQNDINNYDPNLIKQSLNINEDKNISDIK